MGFVVCFIQHRDLLLVSAIGLEPGRCRKGYGVCSAVVSTVVLLMTTDGRSAVLPGLSSRQGKTGQDRAGQGRQGKVPIDQRSERGTSQ
jgi:hypothetical protein